MHRFKKYRLGLCLLFVAIVAATGCGDVSQPVPPPSPPKQVEAPVETNPVKTDEPIPVSLAQESETESWQVIYLGETRIGYVHSTSEEITRDGRKLEQTSTETHMTIERFGQKLKMQILLENVAAEDGELVSFVQETKNPPANSTRVVGQVAGDKLLLKTTIADRTTEQELPWEKGLKSPAYEAQSLAENPLKPGESRSFDVFLPELKKKATVTMTAGNMESVKLFDGTSQDLMQIKTTNTVLPTSTRSWIDEKGNTLKTETDLLGLVMTTYEVSEEEAVKAIAGGELDIAVGSLIRVDPIPKGHGSRKVVYQITTPGEDAAEFLVADKTQSVKRISDETIELTVAPPALPENAKVVEAKPEFLESSAFLQCTDENVIEHADKAAGEETDPVEIARRMEKYVSTTLTNKNFSTAMASAAEVAKNLEGDCTEHAVLLAAMLRAKKIPSRIAVGLVYIERSHDFGGHMWSEAWLDGKWVPLDATLGRGGIGGAHIKMANSSFSDDGPAPVLSFLPMMKVLGKMKIKVVDSE
ncbi:MAG: transglutaminase family protein [Planctomycetaceae bacterium]|nr:transglutaminase family protein [Planctomycetaceae bacterium]MBT6155272.1 transglutaminase family protein [Planctomycetaceae bacterium]MBT6485232.1 transglutaminase family protein [Planctomycetaceae bacterium]MBT6497421.1 transglutaminase family protein [Planctomycetaceae bacterium]